MSDGSPDLRLSQLSDPSLVTSLCSPFLRFDVAPGGFTLGFVLSTLIPGIQSAIVRREASLLQKLPKLIRLIVDNHDNDGLAAVVDKLLRPLADAYSATRVPQDLEIYLDAASAIPSRYRDDALTDLVAEFCASADAALRVLAASTATLVRNHRLVGGHFQVLARDDDSWVRHQVVCLLRNGHFEGRLIEAVLTNAAGDSSESVRRAAAAVIGDVTPLLVGTFVELLEDTAAMESALDSCVSVARYAGFEPIAAPFRRASRDYPKKCAKVLLELTSAVDPSEHLLLYRAALHLRHCPTLIKKLHELSEVFGTKRPFLRFFRVERMTSSAERLLYAKQCVLFVDSFGTELLGMALTLAHDECAAVRLQATEILVALCRKDGIGVSEQIGSLVKSSSEQRLVLAQVIGAVGAVEGFEKAIGILRTDSSPNVRNCIAEVLKPAPDVKAQSEWTVFW
jgi:hypothetical protein